MVYFDDHVAEISVKAMRNQGFYFMLSLVDLVTYLACKWNLWYDYFLYMVASQPNLVWTMKPQTPLGQFSLARVQLVRVWLVDCWNKFIGANEVGLEILVSVW